MGENKALICEKLGELLKLTHDGKYIDRIEYDAERECAVVVYNKTYAVEFPEQPEAAYFNISGNSGRQIIIDLTRVIT